MKRFTDSDKWRDPWFRRLSNSGKLFFLYLCDNCDNAGVWERDDELCQWETGFSDDVKNLLEELGNRVEILDNGRILLPKFVLFQQGGPLSEAKPPHRQIIKMLEKHALALDEKGKAKVMDNLSITKAKVNDNLSITLAKVIGRGNSNSKGKVEGECEGETRKHPSEQIPKDLQDGDFEEAWLEYLVHLDEIGHKRPGKTAVKAMFHKFRKHGIETSARAIRHSIEQNYAGVFPETMTRNNVKKGNPNHADRDYDNPLEI